MSLMINLGMEEDISTVISTLISIHGDKRFPQGSVNFLNLVSIIKGLLEEVRSLTIPLLNEVLIHLIKVNKPVSSVISSSSASKDKYNLCFQILSEMKNILSAPINQLMFQLVNTDINEKENKQSEIKKVREDEFVRLIKVLGKISNEYLINFLSSMNVNEHMKKAKIRGAFYLDIYSALFSTRNSIHIARDYSNLLRTFLDALNSKAIKENDKFKIFRTLCKLLYLNSKSELKKLNFYAEIFEKIRIFFEEVKSEATGTLLLDLINQKSTKYKKFPIKIIRHSQVFLDSKIVNLSNLAFNFNFNLLKNRILSKTSQYHLFSPEKRKELTKLSFIFNNIITKYESNPSSFKILFNDKMFDLLYSQNEEIFEGNKSRNVIILFYLTLSNPKANQSLHKYFLECQDISCVVLKFCLNSSNIKEHIDASEPEPVNFGQDISKIIPNENHNGDVSQITYENINLEKSKIAKKIEFSKIKLSKESGFVNKLEEIIYNKNDLLRTQILDLFNPFVDPCRNAKIENVIKSLTEFSKEDIITFKRAFMIYLENEEIKALTDFGSSLLMHIDEENSFQEIQFLQTLLSVLFYSIKFHINYIQILEEGREGISDISQISPEKLSPDFKYQISKYHMDAFDNVIDFMKKILFTKITNKEVINLITTITKLLFELKNEILIQKISNLILSELSTICFENYEISAKFIGFLYFELNKLKEDKIYKGVNSNTSKTYSSYLFPENFEKYLFSSEKKLTALKLMNELLKFDSSDMNLNSVIFSEKYQTFILHEIHETTEEQFRQAINLLKTEKNFNLKRDLVYLISIRHEILKYEFYLTLNLCKDNQNIERKDIEKFTKKILNKIYELCNLNEDLELFFKDSKDSENKNVFKLLRQLNNIEICKNVNLIFKHFENGLTLKPNHQIKLMNVSLFREMMVRDHLLKKLEKCLVKNKSLYYQLHSLPILTIFFNDPDKTLKNKAIALFSNFLNYLIAKCLQYKDYDKNKVRNVMYKYLPEVYMSYIIMFFVFNSNLNLLFSSNESKYFESIIICFLKILKKQTKNKFDSNFIIQNCIKIKEVSLKGKKDIRKISHVTYVQELIKKDNYSVSSEDYENTKNEICNMIIKIINVQFTTAFKYDNFKPNVPLIFHSEKEISMVLSNLKSVKEKEKEETVIETGIKLNFNNPTNNTNTDFDLSKLYSNQNKNLEKTGIANDLSNFDSNIRSTKAVKSHKLQLEPVSKVY